jgi:DNA modification methylase
MSPKLFKQTQEEIGTTPEYTGSAPLRDFASVKQGTDLESLNLNWTEKDLPERERTKHVHRLHPYLGKYVPQIVEIFLRKFKPARVFDPFMGSGTTLVEANVLGVESFGTDISAFNCLLAQVKTAKYNVPQVEADVYDALSRLRSGRPEELYQQSLFDEKNNAPLPHPSAHSDYLNQWYAPEALRSLLAYRDIVEQYESADLLKVILSRAARSSRRTRHFDLEFPKAPQLEPYFCHKHQRICLPTADAAGFLRRYSLDAIKRIREYNDIRTDAAVHIEHADARSVSLPEIDLVITSPPYIGLIDYHEQHRYSYELLGLARNDAAEIGAAAKGKSKAAHSTFINEIGDVFENTRRYLRKGGHVVIVVGDRENLYEGLAEKLGFVEEQKLRRHVNRRTGRRSTDFFEDVLIWTAR